MAKDKALTLRRLRAVLDRVPELKQKRHDAPEAKKWQRDARVAVSRAFGEGSHQAVEFDSVYRVSIVWSDMDWQEDYLDRLSGAAVKIQSMIDEIEEYELNEQAEVGEAESQSLTTGVFIVHGRDEGTKEEVARFLERLDVETVVLNEVASKGNTIIEKFEAHANVGYAVVLLTGDDDGARKGEVTRPRARQNVIFELGFFIGKLGRERVCALTKGEVEIPSDYAGVVYIPMESDAWKLPLIRELRAAGFQVDANRVT